MPQENVRSINQETEPEVISQVMIQDYLIMEANLAALQRRFDQHEAMMLKALRASKPQERGPLVALLGQRGQRRPAWRTEFERVAGVDSAKQVIANTEEKFSYSVVIKTTPTLNTDDLLPNREEPKDAA